MNEPATTQAYEFEDTVERERWRRFLEWCGPNRQDVEETWKLRAEFLSHVQRMLVGNVRDIEASASFVSQRASELARRNWAVMEAYKRFVMYDLPAQWRMPL